MIAQCEAQMFTIWKTPKWNCRQFESRFLLTRLHLNHAENHAWLLDLCHVFYRTSRLDSTHNHWL